MAGQPPVQGPTRKDYEDEKARKAKATRDIEENVKHVREKQEREHRHEESVKSGTTPPQIRQWKKQEPYKPHGTFGQTVKEKAVQKVKEGVSSGVKYMMTPPTKPEPQKAAPRKGRRSTGPRIKTQAPGRQLGYFSPVQRQKPRRRTTRRQPTQSQDPFAFTGAGIGSFGGGGRQRSELDFFSAPAKGKRKKGRGGILDFTL